MAVYSSATSTMPADLTPAVDKFLSLPPLAEPASPYFMTAKGPAPQGPEPFSLVADELQPLSDYVKELVKSENPVLTMAASHFFDQVRPSPVPLAALSLSLMPVPPLAGRIRCFCRCLPAVAAFYFFLPMRTQLSLLRTH